MPDEDPPRNLPVPVSEQPRGGNGRWRRHRATIERDAEVLDRVSRGQSFRTIARELGYSSVASAHEAFGRARKDIVQDRAGDAREKALLRIEKARELAMAIVEAQHPMTQVGKVVWLTRPERSPVTGEWVDVPVAPVLDAQVNLAGIATLVKLEQEEARLRGTYAPTAAKVQTITDEDLADYLDREEAAADDAEDALADLDDDQDDGVDDAPDGPGDDPGASPTAP